MRKIILFLLLVIAAGLAWYLFIKKYDYQFQMEAKYGPGAVYYEINEWKNFTPESDENISVTQGEYFTSLTQLVNKGKDSAVELYWEFEKENDSVTEVSLNIRSSENKLSNRLAIINPFKSSIYIDTLKQRIIDFKKSLNNRQDTYRIKIEDTIVKSPNLDCICRSSKNIPVQKKAQEMLRNITTLEDYVISRELKLTGSPFVKVTRWNREKDLIDFDFCFPVNLAQDIRPVGEIEFRQVKSFSALKAIYNGNYRSSHLAWNDLLYKADEKNLNTNELPLEIFFNNPKVESDAARTWKAEIYLPVIK